MSGPYRPCLFKVGAQWHHNGLPANMAAILFDQCKAKCRQCRSERFAA